MVERSGGVVFGEPDGFAVVRFSGTVEVLFLALVDHGDAVEEDGEGEDVFGEL